MFVAHFWAPWSEACAQMDAVLFELCNEVDADRLAFFRVDAEAVPDLSLRHKITAVPTFLFFKASHLPSTHSLPVFCFFFLLQPDMLICVGKRLIS